MEAKAPFELLPIEWTEGVCVLEDGTPLPGVEVSNLSDLGGADRVLPGDKAVSGADGSFRVANVSDPEQVCSPSAALVAAEGAEILASGEHNPVWSLRISGARIRLTFRDIPGAAHVRLRNADTDLPILKVKGLRITWFVPGGRLVIGTPGDPGLGGWIPIPEGRLPQVGGGAQAGVDTDLSKVEVEFAMPGYEAARLPLPDIHGRVEVRVRPVAPDASGEVVLAGLSEWRIKVDESWKTVTVTTHLRWTGPDPAPSAGGVLGLPAEAGPFALYGLPDGTWDMEVAATLSDNTVVRGRKAFERHGGTADLGKIVLLPAGRIVLRVVDAAGQPIPQAWAVVVRPEEDPDQGRRLDLNEKGEVSVGDLEPGIAHRVLVKGLPQVLEQTVTAEAIPKPVEFKWTDRLVSCRITLLVDGKAVANPDGRTTIPAVVQDSPLPRDRGAWKSDGTFEAKLVPGTYRFSALATPKDGGPLALFAADATVPSGDSFDTRLELQREAR